MSIIIVEDQVKYPRSLGIQATSIGKGKTIAQQTLNGDRVFSLLFSEDFYPKNTFAVVCDDVHTAVHW